MQDKNIQKSSEIITQLEAIAADLYNVRLPVQEASVYSTVLTAANRIAKIANGLKEEAADEGNNQPE